MVKKWNSNHIHLKVMVLFVLGNQFNNQSQTKEKNIWIIEQESKLFGDILQVDIQESYLNNTLKVISLYNWILQKCAGVHFLMKVDDDVYINFNLLIKEIQTFAKSPKYHYAQIGARDRCPGVQHSITSKQYIMREIFPVERFEFDYAYGFAVLTPIRLLADVHAVSLCLRGIFVDDVYLNGFLPHILGAPVIHWPSLNVQITQSRPSFISWKYISKFSVTPELSIEEIYSVYLEEIASIHS